MTDLYTYNLTVHDEVDTTYDDMDLEACINEVLDKYHDWFSSQYLTCDVTMGSYGQVKELKFDLEEGPGWTIKQQ